MVDLTLQMKRRDFLCCMSCGAMTVLAGCILLPRDGEVVSVGAAIQMADVVESVAACGLVCGLCSATETFGCIGCRKGGGPYAAGGCIQRDCSSERGLAGCWDCGQFPCGRGFFNPTDKYYGICVASAKCIQDHGTRAHVGHIAKSARKTIRYENYVGMNPREIREALCEI